MAKKKEIAIKSIIIAASLTDGTFRQILVSDLQQSAVLQVILAMENEGSIRIHDEKVPFTWESKIDLFKPTKKITK